MGLGVHTGPSSSRSPRAQARPPAPQARLGALREPMLPAAAAARPRALRPRRPTRPRLTRAPIYSPAPATCRRPSRLRARAGPAGGGATAAARAAAPAPTAGSPGSGPAGCSLSGARRPPRGALRSPGLPPLPSALRAAQAGAPQTQAWRRGRAGERKVLKFRGAAAWRCEARRAGGRAAARSSGPAASAGAVGPALGKGARPLAPRPPRRRAPVLGFVSPLHQRAQIGGSANAPGITEPPLHFPAPDGEMGRVLKPRKKTLIGQFRSVLSTLFLTITFPLPAPVLPPLFPIQKPYPAPPAWPRG